MGLSLAAYVLRYSRSIGYNWLGRFMSNLESEIDFALFTRALHSKTVKKHCSKWTSDEWEAWNMGVTAIRLESGPFFVGAEELPRISSVSLARRFRKIPWLTIGGAEELGEVGLHLWREARCLAVSGSTIAMWFLWSNYCWLQKFCYGPKTRMSCGGKPIWYGLQKTSKFSSAPNGPKKQENRSRNFAKLSQLPRKRCNKEGKAAKLDSKKAGCRTASHNGTDSQNEQSQQHFQQGKAQGNNAWNEKKPAFQTAQTAETALPRRRWGRRN